MKRQTSSYYCVPFVWHFDHSRTEIRKVLYHLHVTTQDAEEETPNCPASDAYLEISPFVDCIRIERWSQPSSLEPSYLKGEIDTVQALQDYQWWFALRLRLEGEEFGREIEEAVGKLISEGKVRRGN